TNFGGGNVANNGGFDIFVLKLNSSGTFQWVQTYGGTSSEFAYSVDVDSSDNLYISGEYSNTVDFGGGAETAEAGHCDIFILKLNSSGTFQWVETLGSFGNDRALHITADSSGNSYTTGEFTSTTNFGGGNVANNGGFDIFVLKLNSSGTFQWVQTYGGTSNDRGQNIQLDSSNNPIIVGQFQE
ncbi:MAG: calcium-binding protein, partial [Akkermansiaceae bacterium]